MSYEYIMSLAAGAKDSVIDSTYKHVNSRSYV